MTSNQATFERVLIGATYPSPPWPDSGPAIQAKSDDSYFCALDGRAIPAYAATTMAG